MTVSAWNEQSQPTQGEQRSESTQRASSTEAPIPATPQEPVQQPEAEATKLADDHAPSFDTPDVIDVHVEAVQTEQAQPVKPAHRGRRSPIPSWDEIMFGKAPKD